LRLFYRIASSCFLFTIALLVVLNIVEAVIGAERLASTMGRLPFILRVPFGILGAVSAIGIIFLWYGMIWDCWFTSKMPKESKIRWTLLLVITNMLGALIYYYRIFNKRDLAIR
jgi:hypothetical protein